MTTSENIRSNLSQLIEPFRDQLDDLDKEIDAAEQNLASLRQTRRDVVGVLGRIDPTFVTVKDSTVKPKPKKHVIRSTSRTPEIRDWIVERKEVLNADSGFSAASMIRSGFDMVSQSTLNKALLTLHEEGMLRIDHRGYGGSRYYKVVSNG